ncbi:MAG TPA: holo-ACP synthase [Dissulfurispiraceae bacterium]|nr:holo-ACP synthase [Dissulfurispiraceae bacterium]
MKPPGADASGTYSPMICGIGIDVVNVERLKQAVERWGPHFLRRVFSDHEIEYCYRKRDPYPHLAARFAAKEAMTKALASLRDAGQMPSTYIAALRHFEVVNQPDGRPLLKPLYPFLPEDLAIHLSLSHEKETAVAAVVLERR